MVELEDGRYTERQKQDMIGEDGGAWQSLDILLTDVLLNRKSLLVDNLSLLGRRPRLISLDSLLL